MKRSSLGVDEADNCLLNIRSSWALTGLTHFEVLHDCEIRKDDAKDHHYVPYLVTVATDVVPTWVVSLGTAHCEDVQPDDVAAYQQGVVNP